jgi:hypothetical protein
MGKRLFALMVAYVTGMLGGVGETIPPEIKRQAAFIFEINGTNSRPIGTCFAVGVLNKKSTNGGRFAYLVTAKHVLLNTNGLLRTNLQVRVNRWRGGSEHLPLFQSLTAPPYIHTNTSVDVAVVDWAPNQEIFDFPYLPVEMLADRDAVSSRRIAEGDNVFFPGLFINYYGVSKNIPVIRFGRVSILPSEPIQWGAQLCELYLIETTCFGGNSGSPVFLRHSMDRDGGLRVGYNDFFVAGLLIGYFNELQLLKWVDAAAVPVTTSNSGI